MSFERLTFTLHVTVRSPFLFRGLDGRFVGVDVTHVRDEQGRPVIPADQIRGVFRESLTILSEHVALPSGDIADLFGRSSSVDEDADGIGSNEPARGRIAFDDLVASRITEDPDDPKSLRLPYVAGRVAETSRIQIDDDTGSVKRGALQVLELVAPFGAAVTFEGRVVVFDEPGRADAWAKALSQALALVQSIGAMKSPGWGEVLRSASGVAKASSSSLALPVTARSLPELLRVRVTFDRPILVDAEKVSGNAFAGRTVVPGAVFKGALARRLELAGLSPTVGVLGEVLARLRFRHARPEAGGTGEVTDRPLPLSLVAVGNGEDRRLGDASLIGLDEGATIGGLAARFQPDWKQGDFEIATEHFGRARGTSDIPLIARTHTRIGEEGGAAEAQLFTTLARSALRCEAGTDGKNRWVPRGWIFDMDLAEARVVDRSLADRLIEAMLADGLDGVGRTGAHASFELVGDASISQPRSVWRRDDLWVVTLETAAAMLDSSALFGVDGRPISAIEAYSRYWRSVLPDAELVNFFAAQDYRGGYVARRRRLYDATYFPFLLTREGSVFVLKSRDTIGLARLLRDGLPHFSPASGVAVSWSNSPWVAENGWGEIRIEHSSDDAAADLVGRVKGVGVTEAVA